MLQRVQALPGVESAAVMTRRPLWSTIGYDWIYTIEGQTDQETARNPHVNLLSISPDYFRTMGIRLLRGRAFTERDREGQTGVVIVSDSLARRAWPGQDPIGQRLRMPLPDTPYHDVWLTVVAVAAEARYRELETARLDLYMSYLQSDHLLNSLMVRTSIDPFGSGAGCKGSCPPPRSECARHGRSADGRSRRPRPGRSAVRGAPARLEKP